MQHQRVSPLYDIQSIIKSISKNRCMQNPEYKRIFWERLMEGVLVLRTHFIGWLFTCAQLCPTLFNPIALQSTRLLCPWDSPGKNIGVGCHFLLQGIFPTQGFGAMSPESPALAGGFFTIKPPILLILIMDLFPCHNVINSFRNLLHYSLYISGMIQKQLLSYLFPRIRYLCIYLSINVYLFILIVHAWQAHIN